MPNTNASNINDSRFKEIEDIKDIENGTEIFRYSDSKKQFKSYQVEKIESELLRGKIRVYIISVGDHHYKIMLDKDGHPLIHMPDGTHPLYKKTVRGGRQTLRKSNKRRGKSQKRR